jgi:hypothetical protein
MAKDWNRSRPATLTRMGGMMSTMLVVLVTVASLSLAASPSVAQQSQSEQSSKPNILVIFGDDIGVTSGDRQRASRWEDASSFNPIFGFKIPL